MQLFATLECNSNAISLLPTSGFLPVYEVAFFLGRRQVARVLIGDTEPFGIGEIEPPVEVYKEPKKHLGQWSKSSL
jgi:hypothetical protein